MVDGTEEYDGSGALEDDGAEIEAPESEEELPEESSEEVGEEPHVEQPEDGEALAAVKQQSGASKRIQQEITRRKRVEAELETYRKHVLDIQRQTAVRQPPTEDPDEERRRLEFMDEGQRVQYLVDKGLRQQQTEINRLSLQMNIRDDRTGFNSFIATNPHLKKYAADVEAEFNEALQKGNPKGRAEILTNLIGSEVIKKGSVAVSKARQVGADNIRRQQTRPSNTRSGVTGTGKRTESAEDILKRRLAGGEYS